MIEAAASSHTKAAQKSIPIETIYWLSDLDYPLLTHDWAAVELHSLQIPNKCIKASIQQICIWIGDGFALSVNHGPLLELLSVWIFSPYNTPDK